MIHFCHSILIIQLAIYAIASPFWFRIWYRVMRRHFPLGFPIQIWIVMLGITLFWLLSVFLSYAELMTKQAQQPLNVFSSFQKDIASFFNQP